MINLHKSVGPGRDRTQDPCLSINYATWPGGQSVEQASYAQISTMLQIKAQAIIVINLLVHEKTS